jgi:hypothetical protein
MTTKRNDKLTTMGQKIIKEFEREELSMFDAVQLLQGLANAIASVMVQSEAERIHILEGIAVKGPGLHAERN